MAGQRFYLLPVLWLYTLVVMAGVPSSPEKSEEVSKTHSEIDSAVLVEKDRALEGDEESDLCTYFKMADAYSEHQQLIVDGPVQCSDWESDRSEPGALSSYWEASSANYSEQLGTESDLMLPIQESSGTEVHSDSKLQSSEVVIDLAISRPFITQPEGFLSELNDIEQTETHSVHRKSAVCKRDESELLKSQARVTLEDIKNSFIGSYATSYSQCADNPAVTVSIWRFGSYTLNDYFTEFSIPKKGDQLKIQMILQHLKFTSFHPFNRSDFDGEYVWNLPDANKNKPLPEKIISHFFYNHEQFHGAAMLEKNREGSKKGWEIFTLSIVLVNEKVFREAEEMLGIPAALYVHKECTVEYQLRVFEADLTTGVRTEIKTTDIECSPPAGGDIRIIDVMDMEYKCGGNTVLILQLLPQTSMVNLEKEGHDDNLPADSEQEDCGCCCMGTLKRLF